MIKKLCMTMAVIVCMSTFAFAEHESANPKTDKSPQGQTGTPGMFRLPTLTDCGAPANIIKMITEYEEVAVANGQTFLIKPDGELAPGAFTLFVNPNTHTWTLAVQVLPPGPDTVGIWCIAAAGSDFGPVAQKISA